MLYLKCLGEEKHDLKFGEGVKGAIFGSENPQLYSNPTMVFERILANLKAKNLYTT